LCWRSAACDAASVKVFSCFLYLFVYCTPSLGAPPSVHTALWRAHCVNYSTVVQHCMPPTVVQFTLVAPPSWVVDKVDVRAVHSDPIPIGRVRADALIDVSIVSTPCLQRHGVAHLAYACAWFCVSGAACTPSREKRPQVAYTQLRSLTHPRKDAGTNTHTKDHNITQTNKQAFERTHTPTNKRTKGPKNQQTNRPTDQHT
jgi:hypothetical protein